MSIKIFQAGDDCLVTYPVNGKPAKRQAEVVAALPAGDFLVRYRNGKTDTFHFSWLAALPEKACCAT